MLEEILSPELKDELLNMGTDSDALRRFWRFMRGDRSTQHEQQKKAKFYFPELTSAGWFEIERYPAIQRAAALLESGHSIIRDEFNAYVDGNDAALVPYRAFKLAQGAAARRSASGGPPPEWKALYFFQDGKPNPEIRARFPKTTALVEEALGPVRYPLGEVHYSVLEPGGHIKPHCDLMNFTSSFHLGVTIPTDCALHVDGEARTWTEGRCFLFDHSFTHEAWNRSSQRRVTLIADVWNPVLTELERAAVLRVFRWLYESTHGPQ